MTSDHSELKTEKLRIRAWCHIAATAILTAGALFFLLKHIVIVAILLIGLTYISVRLLKRSLEELSRLRHDAPDAGTSVESKRRIKKLRFGVWGRIVTTAIYALGGLFFGIEHIVIGALMLIGFAAVSGLSLKRRVEEFSRLRHEESDAG